MLGIPNGIHLNWVYKIMGSGVYIHNITIYIITYIYSIYIIAYVK